MTTSRDVDTDTQAAALAYVERGWAAMPMEARGKRPVVAWQELQSRLPTVAEVKGWFARPRAANVGIVTGAVSNLVVVDVDPRHGGAASLAALEREHGPLPVTVEAITGGGGRHLYFAHPGGMVHNKVGVLPGIDVRGDGGCVVAPPSIHPSGNRYRWAKRRSPEEVEAAPLPHWLLALIAPAAGRSGHPLTHWRALVRDGVVEGERNGAIASLAGHLLWHGVDAQVAVELLLAWNGARCRPPLDEEEVARTVESIARLHARQHAPDTPA